MSRTQTVTKTVVCPLVTSRRKNERVREAVDQWQEIAARMADLMPSLGPAHWRTQDSTLFRVVNNEFPDHSLRSHDAHQAAYKVAEAFGSWHANGHDKRRPAFGGGDYARFCHCGVSIEANDSGYGLKVGIEPYKPEWWHVHSRPYVDDHLDDIARGDASLGCVELRLAGTGSLAAHVSLSYDVEMPDAGDVDTVVGVDLGERRIYTAVAVGPDGDKQAVGVEPGREFRHNRERLKQKRAKLSEEGDLTGVRECRDELRRYTDHVTHATSRRIVDVAIAHRPSVIRIERLTGYRKSADAIHDWPFAEMQEKIAYKAAEEGIPVETVPAAGTSQTCSRCGEGDRTKRGGTRFECHACGYDQDADVNAAVNIATSGG